MSSAKITLIGLYRWLNVEKVDLFDAFNSLPESIDKETLVNLILTEGGEFEPLYADAGMMKGQIELFVSQHMRTFTKWVEALAITYNPLENYDRMENWTDVNHNRASSSGNIGGSNTNSVSAYDTNGMSPHDSSVSSSNSSSNGSSDGNSTHTGRTHGNIGVTTSQQMLQSELDIARFNIYQQICDLFIDELLLAVYI